MAWELWASLLGWSDLIVFAVMYLATGLGVTVGFHRLLTHRAFKTTRAIRGTLAALGSAAIEGPVISWVADHRKHHAFADKEGDPHSPHVDHGGGWRGAFRGLFHAHMGWLFIHTHRGRKTRYAPDLVQDPVVSFVDRTFVLWVFAGLGAAFGLGVAIGGSVGAGLSGLLWGGWCGSSSPPRHLQHQLALPLLRPAAIRDRRRVAQPRLARASVDGRGVAQQPSRVPHLRRPWVATWEVDPSALVIRLLERLGLAWDVVRVDTESQSRKLASAETG